MFAQHQRAIDRLTATFSQDPRYNALIIGGSIARGNAREDSDIDIILVATDAAYREVEATKAYHYFSRDFTDYEGGYVDGKIVDLTFLGEVMEFGSEPARSAFASSIIAFTKIPEINLIVKKIGKYPENERAEKIRAFFTQLLALQWYMGEAEKRNDPYLLSHVASDLALFGGRLILAHNRILYPYHKWFMSECSRCPEKPAGFMESMRLVLEKPSKQSADEFCSLVFGFKDWGVPLDGWPVKFMEQAEWNWRGGRPPLEDW